MTEINLRFLKRAMLIASAVTSVAMTNIVYAASPNAACDENLTQIQAANSQLRQAMKDKSVGFAILDVPQLLTPKFIKKVYNALPEFYQDSVFMADFSSPDPHAIQFFGDDEKMRAFEAYLIWVSDQVRAALPEENLRVDYAELRKYEPGTDWQINENVTSFHKDGGWITVTIPFMGPGTLTIAKDKSEHENRIGQAMFVTAKDRTKALKVRSTLHKAPSGVEVDRFVMVIRLSPILPATE